MEVVTRRFGPVQPRPLRPWQDVAWYLRTRFITSGAARPQATRHRAASRCFYTPIFDLSGAGKGGLRSGVAAPARKLLVPRNELRDHRLHAGRAAGGPPFV